MIIYSVNRINNRLNRKDIIIEMVNKIQIVQLQIKQLINQMNSKKTYKQCKTELNQVQLMY
jgi:hypothetical protein